MSGFSHEEQAKRLFGLGGLEAESLEVLRLIVRQTDRSEHLDADFVGRAKAIVERYDRAIVKGYEAPNVVPLRVAVSGEFLDGGMQRAMKRRPYSDSGLWRRRIFEADFA